MTKTGKESIEAQLKQLKTIARPAITAAIASARELGDLKENAEYHAAREKQGMTEAQIRDLEDKVGRAEVIDISKIPNEGKVIFGSYVTIINTDTDAATTYQIVGEDESDLNQNKVSITSPIARAIIGKSIGEEVEVITPKGTICYEIEDVAYMATEKQQ